MRQRNDGSEESMRVVLTDDHLEHDLPDSPELVFSVSAPCNL